MDLNFSQVKYEYSESIGGRFRSPNYTQNLEVEIQEARRTCWENGHNLDEIDRALNSRGPHNPVAGISLNAEPSAEPQNALVAAWPENGHRTWIKEWSTKQDRVNAWLLQSLEASPDLAQLHQSFCTDGGKLHGEDWARSVLKFWYLDEAAAQGEHGGCSTIGAVDSKGARHSTRILLKAGIWEESTEWESNL